MGVRPILSLLLAAVAQLSTCVGAAGVFRFLSDAADAQRQAAGGLLAVDVDSTTSGPLSDLVRAFGNAVDDVTRTVHDVEGKNASQTIADVAGAFSNIFKVVTDAEDVGSRMRALTQKVQEGGHSKEVVNKALLWSLLLVGLGVLVGLALDHWCPPLERKAGRPACWLLGMLLASYILLIWALGQVLFSFTVAVQVMGFQVTVTQDNGHPGSVTESMLSVISTLVRTGSTSGAVLVVLYAMVIPAAKLFLLLLGEAWRCSEDPGKVLLARRCIRCVQLVSKWACPDMFLYILLLYLLRSIGQRSSLIEVASHLDTGFVSFAVFCMCSTFSSLAIHLPPKPAEDTATPAGSPEPFALRLVGRHSFVWLVAALLCAFSTLFVVGLAIPCMGVRLNEALLVEPVGPLPRAVAPLLQALDLGSQVNADVSLLECIGALAQWFYWGEASCILALVMLAGFAVGLVVLNMVFVALAAGALSAPDRGREAHSFLRVARVLMHISMLDVAIMGVVVVCFAAGAYRAQGVELELRWGLAPLLAAEVVHYFTYYTVEAAVLHALPPGRHGKAADED